MHHLRQGACAVTQHSTLITMFLTVFLAELGDKTQLATILFAAEGKTSPWMVFAATAGALVLAAGIGVLVGGAAAKYLEAFPLKLVAGAGFMLIGAWTIWTHFTANAAA